ncbi:MAG TPA: serine protease [Deltaproteobacteria bacterium]|nr:serine protease [Deltaproteobacteria bacterium]
MIGVVLAAWAQAADVDGWLDAVVLLQQGSTTCAGARIDPDGMIATAYHCVASGGRLRILERGGGVSGGRIVGVDVRHDLALITPGAVVEGARWLPLASDPPELGATVWALGHPLGSDPPGGFFAGTLRWSAASGRVSALGAISLQLDAGVNPGSSGGPVVDRDGEVVGIVSRRLGREGLAYAGRIEALEALRGAEPRGMPPLGGTLAAELALCSLDTTSGGLSAGVRAQLALRDRIVLSTTLLAPLSQRWSAARFSASDALRGDGRLGLRARLGTGPWAIRLDGFGALLSVVRLEGRPDDPLALISTATLTPAVGGSLGIRSVGFELGVLPGDAPRSFSGISLRWPGVVSVF